MSKQVWSVSISGDTIVVGAQGDDKGANLSQGAAYVFERNTGGVDNWGEVAILRASDAQASDSFGYSVSISGEVPSERGDTVSATGTTSLLPTRIHHSFVMPRDIRYCLSTT